jgi:preprotein translocase subunit SecG
VPSVASFVLWKDPMQTVLIVIHLMIVVALIGVVLLQRSEGGGLGVGQSGGGFLSSRGTANVLTRTTAILATAFFVMSLALSVVAGLDRKPKSILQNSGEPTEQTPSGTPAGGGVLDQLQKQEQQGQPAPALPQPAPPQPAAPQPPARPSGPQVPRSK